MGDRQGMRMRVVVLAVAAAVAGAGTAEAGTTGVLGTPQGTPRTADCPAGSFARQALTAYGGNDVRGLFVTCQRVDGADAGSIEIGDEGDGIFGLSRCGAGEIAVGLAGSATDVVRDVGLRCGPATGSTGEEPLDCPPDEALSGFTWTSYFEDDYSYGLASLQGRCTVPPLATAITTSGFLSTTLGARSPRLTARLTTVWDGSPLADRLITFTSGATTLCSATTGADGRGSCTPTTGGLVSLALQRSFRASFAGEGRLLPSSANGTL